jgi:hypothetical protein
MPELTDTVTKQELGEAIKAVCRNRHGVPWNKSNMAQCIRRFERMYDSVAPEGEAVTWGELLSAETIKSFCDGTTLHAREQGNRAMSATESYEQTIGTGSISHVVNVTKSLLKHIHASADVDELDMLAAHAEHEVTAAREEANAKVPPFATIVATVHDYATEILRKEDEDIGLLGLSKLAYTLLQTCILPGRERMLLSLRFATIEDFTEDEDHAAETLEALKVQHPAAADYLTLATVVLDTRNIESMYLTLRNSKLIVGTKNGQARKNSFFESVSLEPVLPQAEVLMPLLFDTLMRLCTEFPLAPGSFVLRSKETLGERLLNRNWGNNAYKGITGVTVGTLRKSVEQCAFAMHLNDPDAMSLEMCTTVCKRCQHRPQVAMNKYVRGGVQKQRARLADTEAAGTGDTDGLDGTDGTDGSTDGTDGTDGSTDGTDGSTDGTDGTDGSTDGTDGSTEDTGGTDGSDAETLDLPAAEAPGDSPAPGDMELEATDEIAAAASTGNDIALLVRLANGGTHTFHQSVFAAVYLVDTGGRDVARADTAFDDGALRVTWDEGDHGVFPAITEAAEAPEAAAPEAPEAAEAPRHPRPPRPRGRRGAGAPEAAEAAEAPSRPRWGRHAGPHRSFHRRTRVGPRGQAPPHRLVVDTHDGKSARIGRARVWRARGLSLRRSMHQVLLIPCFIYCSSRRNVFSRVMPTRFHARSPSLSTSCSDHVLPVRSNRLCFESHPEITLSARSLSINALPLDGPGFHSVRISGTICSCSRW